MSIYREEAVGWDITLQPPKGDEARRGALATVVSHVGVAGDKTIRRPLWREDVERLRDACEEALR